MGRGPKLPNQALLTFRFGGLGLPYGATPSLGLTGPALTLIDPAFHEDLAQAATDLVQLTCTSTVTLNELALKIGPEELGPTFTIPVGEPGAEGANQCPPQVSLLVRKVVDGITTKRMGRLFWPGVPEGNVDSAGVVAPVAVTDYQAAFTGFQAALGTPWAVIPAVFDETSDEKEVSLLQVQPRVATQRDRLRR